MALVFPFYFSLIPLPQDAFSHFIFRYTHSFIPSLIVILSIKHSPIISYYFFHCLAVLYVTHSSSKAQAFLFNYATHVRAFCYNCQF